MEAEIRSCHLDTFENLTAFDLRLPVIPSGRLAVAQMATCSYT
jgi:hypothetical protein